MIDREQSSGDEAFKITAENAYDRGYESADDPVFTLSGLTEIFDSTIEQEDYLMGEHQQRSAESGQLDHLVFGHNEPALHHFHNNYREALGQPPLEVYDQAS